jgi:hypothetical protein
MGYWVRARGIPSNHMREMFHAEHFVVAIVYVYYYMYMAAK